MIGNAKECEGLYYFDEANVSDQLQTAVCDSASVSRESEIMLWHFRMGHPSFQYLKHLFPTICSNKNFVFQCEICQLAKHQRTSFQKSKYQPSKPFTMIYGDHLVFFLALTQIGLLHLLMIIFGSVGFIS